MTRWLGWIAIGWLVLLGGLAVVTYGGGNAATSLDGRTQAVASGLRCLVCAGESVAESPSGFARNVRALIRHRLQRGDSPDHIRAYLESRYTNAILLAPSQSGLGNVAWLAPPLLLVGGTGLLITLVAGWRRKGREVVDGRRDLYLERVRAEVALERD